jgi:hypothetical protein
MARSIVRGTPYTHITSQTANQGIRAGIPKGSDGQTTMEQFRGTGMSTAQSARGTPYHSEAGNPDEARRQASHDRYGHVIDDAAGNQADPRVNGSGVVFDGSHNVMNGNMPPPAETFDSPVSRDAPVFDPGFMVEENREHLGHGSGVTAPNRAQSEHDLLAVGGVMSRGMVSTSTPDGDEHQLIQDDILPNVAPAGEVKLAKDGHPPYEPVSKYPKR